MADEYQPMTAAELAAVRERHEKATRGYWHEGNRTATLRAHDHEGTMTVVTVLAESLADVQALTHAWQDITVLLADAAYWRGMVEAAAERMCAVEAENAELREIVRAVAKGPTACGIIPIAHICNFCDVPIGGLFARTDHRANCPVTKARAVLAVVSQAAQTEAEA